tara:strand:- start:1128 stop:1400 length:273 start_codon:yes stop_codon:yes gene_type:complete
MEVNEKQLTSLLEEMKNETSTVRGDEFGIFDYQDLDSEIREQKWMILSHIIDMGRIESKDLAMLFQNNPWFNEWYVRTILSEVPVSETYH